MKVKTILLCLIVWLLFNSMEGTSMANIFFSTSEYQKEIIVDPLLLNKEDVIGLFSGGTGKKMSDSHSFNKDAHLVVRLKNTGNKGAWGVLLCNIEGYGDVQVYIPHLTPNMQEFVNFVIPLSGMITPRPMEKSPTIEVKWEKLNSK